MSQPFTPTACKLFTRDEDILANALISDKAEIMRLDQLAPTVRVKFLVARLKGYRTVSVRWPSGQFALMVCPIGTEMPLPEQVINAYRQIQQLAPSHIFPQGEMS